MPSIRINGVKIYYELQGVAATPLVLVHGSWDSHHDWDLVVPALARSFRVLTYDRRGHSQSERPPGRGSVREDTADLAALIEYFGLAPAWVVGNSFGASIALRLAAARPDLFQGVIAHQPPLFALLAGDVTTSSLLEDIQARIAGVADRIAAGDVVGATEQFVETIAMGPGTWARMLPDAQRAMIENAPTFLDETLDPCQLVFDLNSVRNFRRPVLLTTGDQSPAPFAPVVARLAAVLPCAQVLRMPGAGHTPHVTHPDAYVTATIAFTRRFAEAPATAGDEGVRTLTQGSAQR